jgi:hypothetical protein
VSLDDILPQGREASKITWTVDTTPLPSTSGYLNGGETDGLFYSSKFWKSENVYLQTMLARRSIGVSGGIGLDPMGLYFGSFFVES